MQHNKLVKPSNSAGEQDVKKRASSALLRVNLGLVAFWSVGFLAAMGISDGLQAAAVAVLWALGAMAAGGLGGLLFGIPRMRQVSPDKVEEPVGALYRPEINNNLIEVSDWLTKIIVGLGLLELKELPTHISRLARPLADNLAADSNLAAASGIIVFFCITGFLGGYINARTFLAVTFRRSDDELLSLKQTVSGLMTTVNETAVNQKAQDVTLNLRTMAQFESEGDFPVSNQSTANNTAPDPELLALANEYTQINHPDYQERVTSKDLIATKLVHTIWRKKISKQALYHWTKGNLNDGLILAFASYVLAKPQNGDLPKLIDIASSAKWLHPKFRICLAFRALYKEGFGDPLEWDKVLQIVHGYRSHAMDRQDTSLLILADEIASTIKFNRPK